MHTKEEYIEMILNLMRERKDALQMGEKYFPKLFANLIKSAVAELRARGHKVTLRSYQAFSIDGKRYSI